MNRANLQPLSTANELSAEFRLILTVSYHSPTKLAWFMHCYVDVSGFAQSFTLNWLMDIFKSNDYPENFINDFFKLSMIFFQSFLDSKHRIQEKVITLPKNLCFQPFLVFDHYHCKLELSYENLSRVVSIAANYR